MSQEDLAADLPKESGGGTLYRHDDLIYEHMSDRVALELFSRVFCALNRHARPASNRLVYVSSDARLTGYVMEAAPVRSLNDWEASYTSTSPLGEKLGRCTRPS